MPTVKTEIDTETLLRWAYRDELSKRMTSAAEGIWDRLSEDGRRGPIDRGHGSAQRYHQFGLPDHDAERIERAVSRLEDMVIDWPQSFDTIAGDLAGLISVNEVNPGAADRRREPRARWGAAGDKALQAWWGAKGSVPAADRPRDVLMVGGLRTSALVTMHAVQGSRPDWREEPPRPTPTPAKKGPNAMILGECRGRNLYSLGAQCPLIWEPSPLSIVSSRAEYVAWHRGLCLLAETLQLEKFIALPPKASGTPWIDGESEDDLAGVIPVIPTGKNSVDEWGTLPLAPHRGRKGPPLRTPTAGPVRYPLQGEVA